MAERNPLQRDIPDILTSLGFDLRGELEVKHLELFADLINPSGGNQGGSNFDMY
jgi:hypothetical protein